MILWSLGKIWSSFFYPIFLFSITETGTAPGKVNWEVIPLSYNVVLLQWSNLCSWRDCCAQGTFLEAKPTREAGGEPNLQAAPTSLIFSLRSSRTSALRYGRPSWMQWVSNLLNGRGVVWEEPSLPPLLPLGILETKMAASTGKHSILSILRKNRGLWTV